MNKTLQKQSKPTVTVAVSAYNEGKNISTFLTSVLKQSEMIFEINKIIVVSDGSTDNTGLMVGLFKDSRIQLWISRERRGKSYWLNEIYKTLISDFLIQSDADVVFDNERVVTNMLKPMINNHRVVMCGGNPTPLEGETFIERSVNITTSAYRRFRKSVRGGNNVFSADGRLLAFRKQFIKNVRIPETMIANDAFAYFCCITSGRLYRFVPDAVVRYRSPQTIADQIRQNTRFLAASKRLAKYFDPAVVAREYEIPKQMYYPSILSEAVAHPIHSCVIFMINRFCFLKSRLVEHRLNGRWTIASTTKKLL